MGDNSTTQKFANNSTNTILLYHWTIPMHSTKRSSESEGKSDVTDSLEGPDKFRVPW